MTEAHIAVTASFDGVGEPMIIGSAVIQDDKVFITLTEGLGDDYIERIKLGQVRGLSLGMVYNPQAEEFDLNPIAFPPRPITGRFNTDYLRDPH